MLHNHVGTVTRIFGIVKAGLLDFNEMVLTGRIGRLIRRQGFIEKSAAAYHQEKKVRQKEREELHCKGPFYLRKNQKRF